ncbi:hypothetical protein [Gorillibacterium timonense]|uniref:hypothetical protein n=1 Tax=Gorillibacterium timonense TaxID=1689269 RepID=UPI00071DF96B|nr:hypothetical protein [Gorillibacterium timonense]
MAEGITAVYVRTRLEVTEAELSGLIKLFRERRTFPEVRVLENGSQEIAFPHESNEAPVLEFTKQDNRYVCQASCRIVNSRLAGALRLAVARYKGNAIFHRYGDGFIMAYEYRKGTVVKITEIKDGETTVLYQYHAILRELEELFQKDSVEQEISGLKAEIDRLLDERNTSEEADRVASIDSELRSLSIRLSVLDG